MAKKKLMATAELFLNTKDAKRDAQIFINDLKGKLQDIETAADKMTVFKDMVSYIAQVDKALASLKANNADVFSHMFDGLDENFKKQLEGIFGVDGSKLGKLNVLRDSLGSLNLKSSINEIRSFANELNSLFASVGMDSPFKNIDKEFAGRTSTAHIQKLSTELAKFATVWEGLNAKLAGGFNFGVGGGHSSVGGGALSEVQMLIDNIEKKNKELLAAKERLDKTITEFNSVNKNGIPDDYKIDLTEESIRNLTIEYDRLQNELEVADASSEGFYNTLTKLIEVSLRLKKAFQDVSADDGLKNLLMNASAGAGTGDATLFGRLSRYARTKDPMNKDVKNLLNRGGLQNTINENNSLIEELKTSNDINSAIQKRIALYNQLKEKLNEYNEEQNKEFDTDEEEDESFQRLERIEREIANLTGAKKRLDDIQNVLADLSEDGAVLDDVLQKLYKTLGLETPNAFKDRLENLVAESKAAIAAMESSTEASNSGRTGSGGTGSGGSGRGDGTGNGDGGTGNGGTITAEVDFTTLENTIRTEAASIIDRLDNNTFKVELVKDQTKDIQGVINDILSSVQKIYERYRVDNNQADVDNMKKNLLQLLDIVNTHNAQKTSGGHYQGQELSVALMSDGSFSVGYGENGEVPWRNIAASMVSNLSKTLLGDIHSHPLENLMGLAGGKTYTVDSFSGSKGDLSAFQFSQSLGAKIAGMITGNVLRVLDLTAVTPDKMGLLQKELAKVENRYVNSGMYDKYIGMTAEGKRYYKYQPDLAGQHEVTRIFESMMYEAFQNIGYSNDYIDNAIFKKYNLTDDAQLTDLATRLVGLVSAAEQASPPLTRLEEIISSFSFINTKTDKAKTLFDAYNKGELKASDVFNELVANPELKISETAMQSLLNIDNANQMSPIETLLTNISSTLSNINTMLGNIEANTKPNSEQQLSGVINDLLDLKSGIVNNNLNRGIQSIYNGKDSTRYKYDDVASRANDAVYEFIDLMYKKNDRQKIANSDIEEAFLLVEKFKTALTYVQDLGKQRELFTGGPKDGTYIEPYTGEILSTLDGTITGTYENLHNVLMNAEKVLDPLIQSLIHIKDEAFVSPPDGNIDVQLQTSLEQLSTIIHDFSSAISNFNRVYSGQTLPKMDNIFDSRYVIEASKDITNVADLNIVDEVEQLNKLKTILTEVKNAIDTKTKAFVDEGNIVGQVVGKEIAALKKLSEIVDGITPKVNTLAENFNNIKDINVDVKTTGTDASDGTSNGTKGGSKTPVDNFSKSLLNQKNAFNEYRDGLENVDYVSAELRDELDKLGTQLRQVTDTSGLKKFQAEFGVLQDKITAKKAAFEKVNFGNLNSAENNLVTSFNSLSLDQRLIVEQEYKTAIDMLEQYRVAVKNGKDVELKAIYDVVSALRQKLEVYKEANKEAKKIETSQKTNAKFGSTASINATAKYNSLTRTAKSDQFANSFVISDTLSLYEKSYQRLINMRDDIRAKGVIDESDKEEFKAATTECNNYAKALEKLINDSLKLKNTKANKDDYMLGADFNFSDVESRKAALADFAKTVYGVDVATTDFKDNWEKVVFAVDNGDGTFTQMTARFTDAKNEIVAMAGDTKKAQGIIANFWDELKGKFKSIGAYLVASFSFHEVISVIRQGVQYVQEIDSALTELKKVTDETDASYAKFLQDMAKTGSVIGATVKDLTTMAADWARLGYSMEEAGKLAESTAILLNVSEFQDATAASEALISTMQAFQYTADESQHVVDVLNEVGKLLPVDNYIG